MPNDPTFLDVEDDEQRQNRISTLLERLNTTSSSRPAVPSPTLSIGRERERQLGQIKPPSELLARVQAFLPAISASNDALSRQNPKDVDIENIAEDEAQYIEMNLGLGVFEAKRHPRSRSHSPMSSDTASDVTSSNSEPVPEPESESDSSSWSSGEDSESDSDYSSSDGSDAESQSGSSVDMKPIISRPIKPLPRRVSQQATLEV